MRLILLSIPLLIFLLVQNTIAGEVRVIELIDGSTITGEVLSLNNGIYVIKSESLGTIKLEESKIRAIHSMFLAIHPVGPRYQGNTGKDVERQGNHGSDPVASGQPRFQKNP